MTYRWIGKCNFMWTLFVIFVIVMVQSFLINEFAITYFTFKVSYITKYLLRLTIILNFSPNSLWHCSHLKLLLQWFNLIWLTISFLSSNFLSHLWHENIALGKFTLSKNESDFERFHLNLEWLIAQNRPLE